MTDAHNAAFTILGMPIYWYGILIASSVVLAVALAWAREKRFSLPKDTAINLTLLLLPVGFVCARLYYVAFSWESYSADPIQVFNIRQGGLAIYGGLLGGALAAFLYARKTKIPYMRLADLLAPCLALAQGIGRWGNFANQEAYGEVVANPALQFFPASVFIAADQSWHYATFFYESIWCLLICAFLLVLERRGDIKRVGDGFLLYGMLYAAERAVVEGMRTDSLMMGGIRVSQLLSALALIAIAGLFAARCFKHHRSSAARAIFFGAAIALTLIYGIVHPMFLWIPCATLVVVGLICYCYTPNLHPYPGNTKESQV